MPRFIFTLPNTCWSQVCIDASELYMEEDNPLLQWHLTCKPMSNNIIIEYLKDFTLINYSTHHFYIQTVEVGQKRYIVIFSQRLCHISCQTRALNKLSNFHIRTLYLHFLEAVTKDCIKPKHLCFHFQCSCAQLSPIVMAVVLEIATHMPDFSILLYDTKFIFKLCPFSFTS